MELADYSIADTTRRYFYSSTREDTLNGIETSVDSKDDLEKAIKDCDLDKVLEFIHKTDSLNKCHDFALKAVEKAKMALNLIKDSEYKNTLIELAKKAANRSK